MASNTPEIDYAALLKTLSFDKFVEVFGASPRKARETFFNHFGIRKPKLGSKVGGFKAKREERSRSLFEALKNENHQEAAQEMFRAWFLTKREMLAATLDYMKIEHKQGITDSDEVDKLKEMSTKELKALVKHLHTENVAPVDDIALYLKFMGAKNVEKAV